MLVNAKRFLESLRGGKHICGCGRVLTPCYDSDGKRTGVSHENPDDEWHHLEYFSGMSVELPDAKEVINDLENG